jgi:uncharacterized membrane protein
MGLRFDITAFSLGGAAMYLFDPDRGRRRRALIRDKLRHSAHRVESAISVTSSDLQNRAEGIRAAVRQLFAKETPDDQILVARVRSKIGRVVSHPSALEVSADNGVVRLRGPILEHEVENLLESVSDVAGVSHVRNELEAHRTAQGVPGLQGGVHRPGHKFELLQKNWSPSARLFAGLGGAAALLYCSRRRDPLGLAVGTTGFGLLARALTNREVKSLVGLGVGRNAVEFEQTIQVAAPIEKVFAFWRDFSNFPKFMSHVRKVTAKGEGRSHWEIEGPAGLTIEWEAVITKLVTDNVIAWKSVEGSSIEHAGIVKFKKDSERSTTVHVTFFYNPPAGLAGHSIAALLGFDPKTKMHEDLASLKSLLESSAAVRTSSATQTSRG